MTQALLDVRHLEKHFPLGRRRAIQAVNDVSFTIASGEIVGLVGESGSGKSTIGRLVTRLTAPTGGEILFNGQDLARLAARPMRRLRAELQIVFQDPWASLNPRMTVRRLIEEAFLLHTKLDPPTRRAAAEAIAESVQLGVATLDRYPSGLSGGQLQRVCIARALATKPRLVVLDEPTSSLDLSVRAGILDLLLTLRQSLGTAMLFISHDLSTVQLICDRVLVLYLGQIVEGGTAEQVFHAPAHPYTQALLSARLSPDPRVRSERHRLEGEIPSPISLGPGCLFASRCPIAVARCNVVRPHLAPTVGGQKAACLRLPPV